MLEVAFVLRRDFRIILHDYKAQFTKLISFLSYRVSDRLNNLVLVGVVLCECSLKFCKKVTFLGGGCRK